MSINERDYKSAKDKFSKSKFDEALKIIENVNEKDYDFYLLRSKIYYEINDFYSSLQDAKKCIEENKKKSKKELEPHQIASKCYLHMFDNDNAEKELKISNEISSSSEENKKIENMIQNKKKEDEENRKKYSQYDAFINYMKVIYNGGIYINKIHVKWESDWMRCILSSDNIKENETLIRVPDDLLITLDGAQNSEIGKYFDEPLKKKLNSPHHCLLTAYLLQEQQKGKDSKWAFYFPFLPSSYSSFPIFYTDDEMKLLEGTQFHKIVTDKKQEIKQDYDWICEKYPGFKQYPYSNFCKFREVVSSRIFGVTMKGKKNDIIAPFADLFNHRRPRTTHWAYEDDQNAFVVSSIEDMGPEMEVFDSYGRKCNARFLLNYGFTIEDNEDDEIKIVLTLDNNDPLYKDKVKVLGSSKKFTLVKNCREEQSLLFFSWIRLMEYKDNIKGVKHNAPINLNNEISMLTKVKEIMEKEISKYKRSLSDEEDLLKKNRNNMNFNEFNCCIMRIGEMRIFQYYIDLCTKCIDLFNKKNKVEIEKALSTKSQMYKEYEGYIKEVKMKLF